MIADSAGLGRNPAARHQQKGVVTPKKILNYNSLDRLALCWF